MTVSEAIQNRRSIRKYAAGEKIPAEHMEMLLKAAMMAPSACNTRPWEFVVVESLEIRERIAALHPFCKFLPDASAAIVVCGLPQAQEKMGEEFWPQDCGAAIENLLLQAVELGYGTCWCGVYPVQERAAQLRTLLQTEGLPLAVVAVGTPEEAPPARGYYDEKKVKYI